MKMPANEIAYDTHPKTEEAPSESPDRSSDPYNLAHEKCITEVQDLYKELSALLPKDLQDNARTLQETALGGCAPNRSPISDEEFVEKAPKQTTALNKITEHFTDKLNAGRVVDSDALAMKYLQELSEKGYKALGFGELKGQD